MLEEINCKTCKFFYQLGSITEGQCKFKEVRKDEKVFVNYNDSCDYHSIHFTDADITEVERNHKMMITGWKIGNRKRRLNELYNKEDFSDKDFRKITELEQEIENFENELKKLERTKY